MNIVVSACTVALAVAEGFLAKKLYGIKQVWIYPLVLLAVCVFFQLRFTDLDMIIWGAVFAAVALFFSVKDFLDRKISDVMHLLFFLLGCFRLSATSWKSMVLGFFVCGLPMLIAALWKSGSMGGADIKCMAMIGWIFGWENGLLIMILGLILSLIGALILILFKGKKVKSMPMLPYFCTAAVAVYGIF